jgi:hypothetical protein
MPDENSCKKDSGPVPEPSALEVPGSPSLHLPFQITQLKILI